MPARTALALALAVVTAVLAACAGPASPSLTPVQIWMRHTPMYIAHRGGDDNWPEGTSYAYLHAADWNPDLALEASVWRSSDGVWVVSEERTTGRVFDRDLTITSTPWSVLSTLRTKVGGQPMARLREDVLNVYGSSRILFLDNKQDTHSTEFLDLLGSYAGRSRYVVKSFWASDETAHAARRRGYVTWGYYFTDELTHFKETQARFDMLGLDADASRQSFAMLKATGKPVIGHIIDSASEATAALSKGARGLMVADVELVVPHGRSG
jgi:glycerophosphoryl diester phosphodiesterase